MFRALSLFIAGLLVIILSGMNLAHAGGKDVKAAAPQAAPAGDGAEKVDVDAIKEKYWARGDEAEMGVVQNRLYTKEKKFELGLLGGVMISDPFLSVKTLATSIGYHFNEYYSLHLIAAKAYAGPSSALDTLQNMNNMGYKGVSANYNSPTSFYGIEGNASFLYGKLSLMSKAIIYYDMFLSGGLGTMSVTSSPMQYAGNGYNQGDTVSQSFFTQQIGLGQRFYINKKTSVRFDYRMMHYDENLIQTIVTSQNGQSAGSRANWTNTITLGINILFGGPTQ